MNARLHIEKHAFRNRMAFLLLMVAFACPIRMMAQNTGQLDTLKSQVRFLEIQLDTTIAPKDTTGFFKSIFQVFKFRENRNRTEKERFNEFLKEKIEVLRIKIDSIDIVQSTDTANRETQVTGMGTKNKAESKKTGANPTEIPQPTILLDPFIYEKDTAGLMKRIFQVFKFRANRDRTERKRVQKIIQELIVENHPEDGPKLRIDSVTLNRLTDQFIRINKRIDSPKIDSLSRERAYQAHVNLLKRDLDTLNNALEVNYEDDREKLRIRTDSIYSSLKEAAHACKIKNFESAVPWDTLSINKDTVVRYKRGIKQRIKVMGWHNAREEDHSQDYQFDFLSSINYFGFKLMKDGRTIPPDSVSTTNIPKVIQRAHEYGCDVYLSIYNNSPHEIAAFLASSKAHEKLFADLEPLLNKDIFNGINIYFEELPSNCNDLFTNFITKFGKKLKSYENPLKLMITIPAIIDDRSLEEIKAYDFAALDKFTDYYLILTGNMINSQRGVPQSLSPLYKRSNDITGTVQSTIEFYSDEGLEKSKLFMIVPYSGVEWQVNLNGDLSKNTIGRELKYGGILERLDSLRDRRSITVEGFNPKEVSAYAVFHEQNKEGTDQYKEIWYDDPQSLYRKYDWAVKQKLGGVSLRDLGYDDGAKRYGAQYLELWKVLAAATSKIDTCIRTVDSKSLPSLTFLDYLKCFWSDANWAKLNEVGDDDKYWSYQWTAEQAADMKLLSGSDKSWEDRVLEMEKHTNLFKFDTTYFQQPHVLYISNADTYDPELQTDDQYFYLLLRWRIYARIFLISSFVLLAIGALLRFQRIWYKRYPPKKKWMVKVLNFLQPVFIFFTLICFLAYLFFDPWVDIGGDLNQWIARSTFFILLGLGILFGIYITPYLRSQDLVRKNMP